MIRLILLLLIQAVASHEKVDAQFDVSILAGVAFVPKWGLDRSGSDVLFDFDCLQHSDVVGLALWLPRAGTTSSMTTGHFLPRILFAEVSLDARQIFLLRWMSDRILIGLRLFWHSRGKPCRVLSWFIWLWNHASALDNDSKISWLSAYTRPAQCVFALVCCTCASVAEPCGRALLNVLLVDKWPVREGWVSLTACCRNHIQPGGGNAFPYLKPAAYYVRC